MSRLPLRVPRVARDAEVGAAWAALRRLLIGGCLLMLGTWFAQVAWRSGWAVLITACLASAAMTGSARSWAWPWIRSGRVRRAFAIERLLGQGAERRSQAVVSGALALASRANHDVDAGRREQELSFLEHELSLASPRAGDGLLAFALLRALRGDQEVASPVFELLAYSRGSLFSGFVRRTASQWLAADLARRGEFEQLAQRSDKRFGSGGTRGRYARFLVGIAKRLAVTADAPSDRRLRWLFWFAPRKARTRALLNRALAKRAARPEPRPSPDAGKQRLDPLGAALTAHRDLLVLPARTLRLEALRALGAAADAWAHVNASQEARGQDAEQTRALSQVSSTAMAELVQFALQRELPLWQLEEPGGATRVYDAVCEALFQELEERLGPLMRRVDAGRPFSPLDEWLEWASLRKVMERAHRVGGERVRRGAFAKIHREVTHYAVWLFNVRRLHLNAHAIFQWLEQEAIWMQDEKAIELCAKNARCQPT